MEAGESNSNKGLNGMMMMLSQNPIIKIQSKIKELENGFQFKIKELENGFQFKIKELENGFQFKKEKLKLLGADGIVIKAAWGIISAASDGYLLGYLVSLGNKFAMKPKSSLFRFPVQLFSGGPIVQARNFVAAAAVRGSILCMLEGSNDKYALKSVMIAGLGAGAMFSLVNGMGGRGTISIKNMLETGLFFALVNGGAHMFSEAFHNGIMNNSTFTETQSMLMNLGLQHYESNFEMAHLDDTTLPFLTDSALKDANIPPGSRIRILKYIERDRVAGQNQRK